MASGTRSRPRSIRQKSRNAATSYSASSQASSSFPFFSPDRSQGIVDHQPCRGPPTSVLIPHRPTKLLVEPAACKSLKIQEVASRALASLLITERGNGGNRAGNRAAAEATRATSLRFSLGERAKKIPADKGWDFEYWWTTFSAASPPKAPIRKAVPPPLMTRTTTAAPAIIKRRLRLDAPAAGAAPSSAGLSASAGPLLGSLVNGFCPFGVGLGLGRCAHDRHWLLRFQRAWAARNTASAWPGTLTLCQIS